MASGTLPEFYDYKEINGRKFWDGGLLSNTPFRELLQAHQEYWMDVVTSQTGKEGNNNMPYSYSRFRSLYSKSTPCKTKVLPTDLDGVKDRENDIIYSEIEVLIAMRR